jgi:hypothetical protein
VQNAEIYGQWLGQRYRDKHLIWILGGDRTIRNEEDKDLMRAMARGIRKGDGGRHLMTFHPRGGQGSAQYFHDEPWLDFNMRQNGHNVNFQQGYQNTRIDYDRTPIKPVLDGEPIYEDHPVRFRPARKATRSPPTSAGRCIGICSPGPSGTPTATTRSGRCGSPAAGRSTTR